MTSAEESFRSVEAMLDAQITADAPRLVARGITLTDRSERQYNYKSPFLNWEYQFDSRKALVGPGVGSVTVTLSFSEPADTCAPMELALWSRSEIFQVGALSRWSRTNESVIPISEVQVRGIGDIVGQVVDEGFRELDAAGQ